jgi:hypothetical protein
VGVVCFSGRRGCGGKLAIFLETLFKKAANRDEASFSIASNSRFSIFW